MNSTAKAVWSGTSFAGPIVVAALAQKLSNDQNQDAVKQLVDGIPGQSDYPDLTRIPMLGTLVNQTCSPVGFSELLDPRIPRKPSVTGESVTLTEPLLKPVV